MPERNITTSEATIKTCAVQVKALTLNNKQMTLSVFRQLPREPIIGIYQCSRTPYDENWLQDGPTIYREEIRLKGVPWGLINYFWNGCGKSGRHLHVIWETEGVLYRSCVERIRVSKSPEEMDYVRFDGDTDSLPEGRSSSWGDWYLAFSRKSEQLEIIQRRLEEWNALYDQLAALDQLFIAV